MATKMKVKNLKDYAFDYKFVVVKRGYEDDLWFWGAFDDLPRAVQAAGEVVGLVLNTEDVERD